VLRKLEMLKAEKRLLKDPRLVFALSSPRRPLGSIRPLMVTYLFANKLRKMTGTARLRFDPVRPGEDGTGPDTARGS
jgi:hypothetical protein